MRFRVVRLSFFTTSGSVVYWSSHTTSKKFSMVITSLCPVCLATSSVQTLVEGQREFLKIYHCPNHGSFAVLPDLDVKLQAMRCSSGYKIEHSEEAIRLDARLRESIRPVDGPQSKIPVFRSV